MFDGETDDRGVIERAVPGGPETRLRSARRVGERWQFGPAVETIGR